MRYQKVLSTAIFALCSVLGIAAADNAEASHRHHRLYGYGPGGFGHGLPLRTNFLPAVVIGGGYPPHHRQAYRAHHASPQQTETASPKIFAYPAKGQSQQQQARDKFECYSWAVDESGFDPVSHASLGGTPSATPVAHTVRPNNPGPSDPITGAAGGAALGAIGGAIAGDAGLGAAIGAAVGGGVGLANEVDEKSREKTVINHTSTSAGPVSDYRRAMTACLIARGYTVQ